MKCNNCLSSINNKINNCESCHFPVRDSIILNKRKRKITRHIDTFQVEDQSWEVDVQYGKKSNKIFQIFQTQPSVQLQF